MSSGWPSSLAVRVSVEPLSTLCFLYHSVPIVSPSTDAKIKRNIFELEYSVHVAFATEHSLHREMESDTFLWFLSGSVDKGLLTIHPSRGFKIYQDKNFASYIGIFQYRNISM